MDHLGCGHRRGRGGCHRVRAKLSCDADSYRYRFDVVAGAPEEFGRFMKNEVERWTLVVERGGIKPD